MKQRIIICHLKQDCMKVSYKSFCTVTYIVLEIQWNNDLRYCQSIDNDLRHSTAHINLLAHYEIQRQIYEIWATDAILVFY